MLCTTEYHIIKKGFFELNNQKDFLCYAKKDCLIDQIIIRKDDKYYHLSFPMKNSAFNYITSFENIEKLNNYIKNYI